MRSLPATLSQPARALRARCPGVHAARDAGLRRQLLPAIPSLPHPVHPRRGGLGRNRCCCADCPQDVPGTSYVLLCPLEAAHAQTPPPDLHLHKPRLPPHQPRARPPPPAAGVYMNSYDAGLNVRNGFPVFGTLLEANYVNKQEDAFAAFKLSDEDRQELLRLARDPRIGAQPLRALSVRSHATACT